MSKRELRVALCQFYSIPHSKDADNTAKNLGRALSFVEQAASKGATLIVFPEYFITSVVAEHHHLAHPKYSDQTDDKGEHWLDAFKKAATTHDIDIVVGTIVEKPTSTPPSDHPQLNNIAHYIDRHGQILGRYHKRNLWHPEKSYLSYGEDDHLVFETEFGRVGLLICWDLAFSEAFRSLLFQKADLVIIPSYWSVEDAGDGIDLDPDCESKFLNSTVVCRAFENECAVVFVNCGGPEKEGFIGCSQVAVPFKGCVGRLPNGEEGMEVVDVDMSTVPKAREVYAIRDDLLKSRYYRDRTGTTGSTVANKH